MQLVIDWGNSLIKVATFNEDELVNQYSFASQEALISFLIGQNYKGVLVSSVKGDPNVFSETLKHVEKVVYLNSSTPLPIKNLYSTPTTLGMDRMAAACGAWHLNPAQPSFVIDLGSCINYEFVDDLGNYQGGAISPGVAMRFEAMHQFTAKLPAVKPISAAKLIGDSTLTCLQSGVMNGVAAEINGFVEAVHREHPNCKIILCGGDAHFFEDKIKGANFVPEVVLIGLNAILQCNLTKA